MTNVPNDLKYTQTHEWLKVEGKKGRMGLTDYAQHQLSDIVFVEFPVVGRKAKKGEAVGVVESVKSVSDMCVPVGGTIVEVNKALTDNLEAISKDPYGKGWYAVIEIADPKEINSLMDAAAYKKHIHE